MSPSKFFIFVTVLFLCVTFAPAADILVADFEGGKYGGGWKSDGTAFGVAPANGTLRGQMNVSGFLGNGLVNSFFGGDDSVGKLISPSFKIERHFISFLIGGGGHNGLAINLIIDNKIVRTAAGTNVVSGGSEHLDWFDWNVAEFIGKDCHIEIIDSIGGSWGHINVDHIIQTDNRKMPVERRVEFVVEKEFLHIPITMSSPVTWVRVEVDGVWQQEFDCPLTVDDKVGSQPDFYSTLQIGQWKGKKLTLVVEKFPSDSNALTLFRQADAMSQAETVYTESLRPRFHFTARTGWINDPNGLLYYNGVWHLFFQYNPYSTNWGNMTWGHATSRDLLHWTEQPAAIHPDKLGTIFSGSGVVDWNNTSGFQRGDDKPLVLIYTANGPSARFGAKTTQGIAYSTDAGKTFSKYEHNPVVPHIVGGNRDPKVIWHEPTKRWVMALYLDKEDYALFVSSDLKTWDKLCDIENLGCSECPDFFPLAVDGDAKKTKWVFWGGNGKYLIGSFDGKEFKRESVPLTNKYGGNDYAAMTFSDVPNGRRIQLSWMQNGQFPRMPFNQQFTVPRELTLRTTAAGVRLFVEPVKELETLRGEKNEFRNVTVKSGQETMIPFDEQIFDAEMTINVGGSEAITLEVASQQIEFKPVDKQITLSGIKAPLDLRGETLKLRILVDRTSMELFAQNGEVQIAKNFMPNDENPPRGITIKSKNGEPMVEGLKVWKMGTVW